VVGATSALDCGDPLAQPIGNGLAMRVDVRAVVEGAQQPAELGVGRFFRLRLECRREWPDTR
jgi:hypothetical protein